GLDGLAQHGCRQLDSQCVRGGGFGGQQRLDLPPQVCIVRTVLLQKSRTSLRLEIERTIEQLTDLLPAFAVQARSPSIPAASIAADGGTAKGQWFRPAGPRKRTPGSRHPGSPQARRGDPLPCGRSGAPGVGSG